MTAEPTPAKPISPDRVCPCLSGERFGACCGPIHAGEAEAATAERLMRSRYSAFAVGDAAYLLRSWHSSTRPATLDLDADVRWFGLEILDRERGGVLDDTGVVEFRARFRADGVADAQQERSRFLRENGLWTYLDAV